MQLNVQNDKLIDLREQIKKQLTEVPDMRELPAGEMLIRVDAERPTEAYITISYLVAQAGWFAKYDVRFASIDRLLELQYKAEVFQSTGAAREDVKLIFSNATPTKSGQAPELACWQWNYLRNTQILGYSRA